MITYGFSIQGKGHFEKGVICQDSNKVERIKSGHYVGIVADGVGSAPHSDIGSDIAVKSLFQYCNDHIEKNCSCDTIKKILADAYAFALEQIQQYIKKQGAVIEDFDTTLSSVVYDGKTVVYGHVGDGGIIVKCADGKIKPITSRQKGADGISVIPLRAGGSSWVFGIETKVASVLLVTDGMLDCVIQPVLVNLPPDKMALVKGDFEKDNVYVTAAEFFMNPASVYQNRNIKNPDEYMNYFLEGKLSGEDQQTFLKCIIMAYTRQLGKEKTAKIVHRIKKYYYAVWAVKKVTDDKSVVCIMNEKVKITPQDIKYYEEPDWKWRQESYNALLYGESMPEKTFSDPLYQRQKRDEKTKGNSSLSKKKEKVRNDEGGGNDIVQTDFGEIKAFEYVRNKLKLSKPLISVYSLVLGVAIGVVATILITTMFRGEKRDNTAKSTPVVTTTEQPKMLTKGPPTLEPEINFKEEAEHFLDYLIKIDVSNISTTEKKNWNRAIKQYDFSDCIEIFDKDINEKKNYSDEELSGDAIENERTSSDIKNRDDNIDKMIVIMKETFQKHKVDDFKEQLENTYICYEREQRMKIRKAIKKMDLDDIPETNNQKK